MKKRRLTFLFLGTTIALGSSVSIGSGYEPYQYTPDITDSFKSITPPVPVSPPPAIKDYKIPISDLVTPKPSIKTPTPAVGQIAKPTPTPKSLTISGSFVYDRNVSWYGPGFYGHHTACGKILTTSLLGVAHKTLPCGTLVTFKWGNIVITAPVVDRGPYVTGRQWDLTGGLCMALHHCFTGPIYYRLGR